VRPLPPGWGYQLPPHPYPRRRPALGGVTVLVVVTVLAWLAAPQAHRLRPVVDQVRRADLPGIRLPQLPAPPRPPAPARPQRGCASPTRLAVALPATGPRRGLTAGCGGC
jgi:hypothetical protein